MWMASLIFLPSSTDCWSTLWPALVWCSHTVDVVCFWRSFSLLPKVLDVSLMWCSAVGNLTAHYLKKDQGGRSPLMPKTIFKQRRGYGLPIYKPMLSCDNSRCSYITTEQTPFTDEGCKWTLSSDYFVNIQQLNLPWGFDSPPVTYWRCYCLILTK